MLSRLFVAVFPLFLYAAEQTMPTVPPAPPKKSLKDMLPKECAALPPMLVVLPPPMQSEMRQCKNAFHLPKSDKVQSAMEALTGKKVTVKQTGPAEGFDQLYRVVYTVSSLLGEREKEAFCNREVTHCLFNTELKIKPEGKQ